MLESTDWITVIILLVGLGLIFLAGFWSGRLWEWGTQVRRVMTGEDPPPWDPDAELRVLKIQADLAEIRRLGVRRGPYDWSQES